MQSLTNNNLKIKMRTYHYLLMCCLNKIIIYTLCNGKP